MEKTSFKWLRSGRFLAVDYTGGPVYTGVKDTECEIDFDHATFMYGKGYGMIIPTPVKNEKSMSGAPENKVVNTPENKSSHPKTKELIEFSDDELKAKYKVVVGKKPHHNAGRDSMIAKIREAS